MNTHSSKWQTRWKPALVITLLAGLSILVLSACGSSSSSSSSSTSSGGSTEAAETEPAETEGGEAELSGEPVKVMTVAPLTSSTGSSVVAPEIAKVAEATEEYINANGGIGGRPLESIVCDEKGEPAQDTACARQAVEEGVIADLGNYGLNDEKAFPVLEPAKIASLGNIPQSAAEGTSPISFPLNGGSAVIPALGLLAAEQPECKETGLVQYQGSTVELVEAGIKGAMEAKGKKLAYDITIPFTATDYSGVANEIAQKGDCTILFITAQGAEAMVPAIRQVTEQPILAFTQALTPEVVGKLGSSVEGAIVPQYFPLYNTEQAAEYKGILEKYSDVSSYDPTSYLSMNTYLSMRVFAEVAEKVKNLTSASFLEALNESKNVNGFELAPPLNLTKANEWTEVPFQSRIFNRNVLFAKVENEELKPYKGTGFHDMTKIGGQAFAPPGE